MFLSFFPNRGRFVRGMFRDRLAQMAQAVSRSGAAF
jgi:hypothetical protein